MSHLFVLGVILFEYRDFKTYTGDISVSSDHGLILGVRRKPVYLWLQSNQLFRLSLSWYNALVKFLVFSFLFLISL